MTVLDSQGPVAVQPGGGTDRLGWFPPIACLAGLGLLICSLANALSRATLAPSPLLYWAGLLIIALPIFYRLTSNKPATRERLALVVLLGLTLYSVKLVRDSQIVTFSDEFVHAFNAQQIGQYHHLFRSNPILPATPYYPGLEGATSALTSLTGMSSFGAGIIVVGAARLCLVMAMFFLFQRISGSARTAGIGVAIYAGNFNFLFWGAQYSYESLALPLFVIVLMLLAERSAGTLSDARSWAVSIVLGIAAIVVTHHLTAYALIGMLVVLAALYEAVHRRQRWLNPWPFAVLALVLSTGWLVVVASKTVGYLSPVLTNAVKATFNTATGEAAPRALFQASASTIPPTPIGARVVALAAVAILAIGLMFGLPRVWRRYRSEPFALLFALGALGFFATLALRLAPAAWETGNRASEFFFIGLAFVIACVGLETWGRRSAPWLGRAIVTAGLGIILVGGAIAGWPWDSQLASPIRVTAGGATIESEPLAFATWAGDHLPGQRFAATTADARMLLYPEGETALVGKNPDVKDILEEPALSDWELPLLRRHDLRFVVVDRRVLSDDGLRGYSFAIRNSPGARNPLLPKQVVTKFAQIPSATRVFDSGSIVAFDLRGRP